MFLYWKVPLSSPNGSWKQNCILTQELIWVISFRSLQKMFL
jgi:hypothetical protein